MSTRSSTIDRFPSAPLPDPRHQQVRALLVREASGPRSRAPMLRWAVPLAAVAVAAAVVAGTGLLGQREDGPATTAPAPGVGCAAGTVPGVASDVPDAWRLLSDDPGALQLRGAFADLQPTTCGDLPTDRPLQVLAAVRADGVVTAALTVWADSPAPGPGPDAESVTVRGVEGTLRLGTAQYGTERVWWTEDGQDLSVSSAGLDRATLVATVERLTDGGTTLAAEAAPEGLSPLAWETPDERAAYEPVWYADYRLPGTQPGEDASTQDQEGTAALRVARRAAPWQAELSLGLGGPTPPRLVDVAGSPGLLFDNGTGLLWLAYSLGDGVQVNVGGAPGEGTSSTLDFARTLVPVAADDPRIVPLDPAPETTAP